MTGSTRAEQALTSYRPCASLTAGENWCLKKEISRPMMPLSGWDGTYKGKPASTDTYIYMIDIICENASIITYKGNVTLIS